VSHHYRHGGERAWEEEADRRYQAYLTGDEQMIPAEEVMAAIRKEFNLWSRSPTPPRLGKTSDRRWNTTQTTHHWSLGHSTGLPVGILWSNRSCGLVCRYPVT